MHEKLRAPTSIIKYTTISLIGLGALSGCGQEIQDVNELDPVVHSEEVVFEGTAYDVTCYGPNNEIVVEDGDTLADIIDATKVSTPTQIGGIGKESIPKQVYFQAIADLNELKDPDLLQIDQPLTLPDLCTAEPVLP